MHEKFALPLMRANAQYSVCPFGRNGWGNIRLLALDGTLRWRQASRLWFGCALLFFSITGAAHSQGSRDDQLEAEFIYKFAEFTTWPERAFASPNSPLIIDILGNDSVGNILGRTIRGETIGGRRLIVERYRRAEEVKTCHILF